MNESRNGNATEEVLKNALLCGTGYNAHQRPVKNQQDRVAMYIGADVMNVELVGFGISFVDTDSQCSKHSF